MEPSEYYDFWTNYLDAYPEDEDLGFKRYRTSNCWLPIKSGYGLIVSAGIKRNDVHLFVRGETNTEGEKVIKRLAPYEKRLRIALGAEPIPYHQGTYCSARKIDAMDCKRWPECFDWLHERANTYVATLRELS